MRCSRRCVPASVASTGGSVEHQAGSRLSRAEGGGSDRGRRRGGDSAKNHEVFKKVHKLNFTLLADEDGSLAKKFGVTLRKGGDFPTKDADGNPIVLKRGVTASRWTFVINKDGKIIYKNIDVKPEQDSKQILELVEKQS